MCELGWNDGGGADDVRIAVAGEIVRLLERGHRDGARRAAGRALRHLGGFRGLEMGTQPDPKRLRTREHALAIALEPVDIEQEARRLKRLEAPRARVGDGSGSRHHTKSSNGESDVAVKSGRHSS